MRKLHSTDLTTVTRVLHPSRDSMLRVEILPHSGLYTSDFNRLTIKPPFHISITGVVAAVKPVAVSNGGVEMQDFRLIDGSGKYVMCKAVGRHAGNTAIANGNKTILYFANAKVGLSNQPGSLWLYNETHVAVVAPAQSIPVAKFLMELRG